MPSEWTNLAEDAKGRTWGRGPRCQVQELLNHLPGEAADEVEKTLADSTVSNTGLFRAIRARLGESAPSLWSIGNHRRGNCRCGSQR